MVLNVRPVLSLIKMFVFHVQTIPSKLVMLAPLVVANPVVIVILMMVLYADSVAKLVNLSGQVMI